MKLSSIVEAATLTALACLLQPCSAAGGPFAPAAAPAQAPSAAFALDPGLDYTAARGEPITYEVDFRAIVTAPYHTKEYSWMTSHQYVASKSVPYPFKDWSALNKAK